MISSRSWSVKVAQPAISSRDRRQPVHSLDFLSIWQILIQGDTIRRIWRRSVALPRQKIAGFPNSSRAKTSGREGNRGGYDPDRQGDRVTDQVG